MVLHRAHEFTCGSITFWCLTCHFPLQHWLEDDDLDKVMKNYDENEDGGLHSCMATFTYCGRRSLCCLVSNSACIRAI